MIGLSPLSTAHPNVFQHELVRPSTPCYGRFSLAMDRSLGFGSTPHDWTRYSHSLSLRLRQGLNLAVQSNSQAHYAKGMQQPQRAVTACKRMVSGSISLPSTGFFSPFPHGTGALSVTDEYLALEGGPPGFRPRFTCAALLGILVGCVGFSHTGLSPCIAQHSRSFR